MKKWSRRLACIFVSKKKKRRFSLCGLLLEKKDYIFTYSELWKKDFLWRDSSWIERSCEEDSLRQISLCEEFLVCKIFRSNRLFSFFGNERLGLAVIFFLWVTFTVGKDSPWSFEHLLSSKENFLWQLCTLWSGLLAHILIVAQKISFARPSIDFSRARPTDFLSCHCPFANCAKATARAACVLCTLWSCNQQKNPLILSKRTFQKG